MKALNFSRCALSISLAAALLTACTRRSSVPISSLSGRMTSGRTARRAEAKLLTAPARNNRLSCRPVLRSSRLSFAVAQAATQGFAARRRLFPRVLAVASTRRSPRSPARSCMFSSAGATQTGLAALTAAGTVLRVATAAAAPLTSVRAAMRCKTGSSLPRAAAVREDSFSTHTDGAVMAAVIAADREAAAITSAG